MQPATARKPNSQKNAQIPNLYRSFSKIKRSLFLCINCLFMLFHYGSAQAPQKNITFKITAQKGEAVPFATVKTIPASDTANAVEKISDSAGLVTFLLSSGSQYIVQISSVNHTTTEKRIIINENSKLFSFTLESSTKTLNNVVVTSSRPVIRQEDDKTIVDPENLAASSTNAYEIIEKTPGLFVDQDGNIYLSSTTPATIYINGREQKMSTADIATLLKSLPPNSIASIEIIRTPSAKYDASTSGGIVNVILKKGVKIGLTGSANAGMNQGVYGNQFIGVNINNSNNGNTGYLNLQYSKRNTYEDIATDRYFTPDSILRQDAFTKYPANSFYLGYGLGYEWKKKWEFNYDGRFTYNENNNNGYNNSLIIPTS